MMILLRKWLILIHRYLGIPLSAVIVLWFGSGIVMMYAGGMPSLTSRLRLERLPALDLSQVRLTPAEAAESANLTRPSRVSLFTVMDRPAYRFGGSTVFADTGETLKDIGLTGARTVASRFSGVPEDDVQHVSTLTQADQWTLAQTRQMPVHKFRVNDDAGSELYVSPQTAEVTVLTTRRSRALAWIGTIPHWLYFSSLRLNQSLWYSIVVWMSTLGCILAVIGLMLGVTQFRWRLQPEDERPTSGIASRIPYSRWLRWHYITGVVFGLFTLTWVFSGLLSMEPYAWTNARGLEVPRDAFSGGPLDLARFPPMNADAWARLTNGHPVMEVDFVRIQDDPYYVVQVGSEPVEAAKAERLHQPYYLTGQTEPNRLLVATDTMTVRDKTFSVESLMARLTAAAPGVSVVESALLTEYDSYYYSRGGQTPLPVLRVKFADPAETWFYIDPEMSQVLGSVHRFSRVERWLFNGLHSLDFGFWYDKRPLWDIGMIALSLGGLASSGIGLWLGLKRVRRALGRVLPTRDHAR